MRISSRGIVIKSGKVLLIYRERKGNQYYSIPGGKTEPKETIEETVIREILEETCIDVKPIKLLGNFKHPNKDKEHNLFLCEYIKGEPKLGDSVEMKKMKKDPTEVYKPEWVNIKDIYNLKIQPEICESFFKDFVKSHNDQLSSENILKL